MRYVITRKKMIENGVIFNVYLITLIMLLYIRNIYNNILNICSLHYQINV